MESTPPNPTVPVVQGERLEVVPEERVQADVVRTLDVTAERMAAMQAVCAPVGADANAPMMFAVAGAQAGVASILLSPYLDVDTLRLFHRSTQVTYLEQIQQGDQLRFSASLVSEEQEKRATDLDIEVQCRNQRDKKVAVVRSQQSVLAPRVAGKAGGALAFDPTFDAATEAFTTSLKITDDMATQYAVATGDANPLYSDVDVAQMAGLPRPILQPHAVMALIEAALARHVSGRLESLTVAFARVALPGETLLLEVRQKDSQTLLGRVQTEEGVVVIPTLTAVCSR